RAVPDRCAAPPSDGAADRSQPERPAASRGAGHDFPDDLLRRRPERARVSGAAARCVSALRRADAADVSARLGDAARFGGGTFSHQVQAAARGAAGAGRSGVERAAAGADSAGRRRIVHRRVADDRTTDDASRRSDPRPRSDARRRRAIDARPHAARSPDAARQDDPGGQAPRRDAAAPVHSRPRAGLPRWPRAGAHDRLRVLPQSVRARARRTAGRGAPPRPGTALDCHDIEQGFNASFFSSGFSGGSAGCGTPRSPLRFRSSFCGSSPATTTSASDVRSAARRTAPPRPADRVLQLELATRPSERLTLDAPVLTALGGEREKRRPVALSAIPERMVQAVLAIEDHRFYEHPGIDPIGVVGAFASYVTGRRAYLAGGSTITQQLVRNVFLPKFGMTLQ